MEFSSGSEAPSPSVPPRTRKSGLRAGGTDVSQSWLRWAAGASLNQQTWGAVGECRHQSRSLRCRAYDGCNTSQPREERL